MFKRYALFSLLLIVVVATALIVLDTPAPAYAVTGNTTITGTVNAGDPMFDTNKVLLDCTLTRSGSNWSYETRTITVEADIWLNFFDNNNSNGNDTQIGVYDVTDSPFDPSGMPLTSQCMGAGTNNFWANLSPGRVYMLVLTGSNNPSGVSYSINITTPNGAVNYVIGAPGGAPPVTPRVTSITTSKPDGTYGAGEIIDIIVNFNVAVQYDTIGRNMTMDLNTGVTIICEYCNLYPAPNSTTYTFRYVVGAGQNTADLDVTSANINLWGGQLRSTGGTPANTALPTGAAAGSLATNKNIAIDTRQPQVTNVTSTTANGPYVQGESINVQVVFDEAVNVTGTPTIALNTWRSASYVGGSGTTTLNFTYVVQANDTTGDLNYTATNALSLAVGTMRDAVGNNARLTLPNPAGAGSLGTNKNIQVVIPTISISDVTVNETAGGTTAGFTVSVTPRIPAAGISVGYVTVDSSATASSDYTTTFGTLTFSGVTTSQLVSVPVLDDSVYELSETFFVNLSGATNATIADAQGIGTINDNDPQPSVSITDVSLAEGNSGSTNMVFTVSLSGQSSQTITLNYATADGTATTTDNDYAASSGTLTFNPLATTQTVTVPVTGDTLFEPNETLFVNLSNVVNATVTDAQGSGTITNDDTQPSFSINDVSLAEGDSGTTVMSFTVTRSGNTQNTDSVQFTTQDDSANTADNDYVASSGTLTFAPTVTTQTVDVTINGDGTFEADETFRIMLSNAGAPAIISDAEGVGTISNDDGQPTFSIADVSLAEGDSGTTIMSFTVTRSNNSKNTDSVQFATQDDSATTADSDYVASSGTLTFAPTVTTQTVDVTINGDGTFEADETLKVLLSNPSATAVIADAEGVGTVSNDDGQPTFSIADVSLAEGNSGTTIMSFTVTRSNNSKNTDSVQFATQDDSATTADNDYVASSGTLTFAPTVTTLTVDVTINGDGTFEADETLKVLLSNPSATAVISDAEGVGTITNDEALPGLSVNDVTVAENAGTGSWTVTLSPPNASPVTVDYTITSGTAIEGTHFTATMTGTLTFAPGESSKSISFSLIDNAVVGGGGEFTVTLSNAGSTLISDATGKANITDDEAPPPPVVPPPGSAQAIDLPIPPPATACADVNFEADGMIRTHFTVEADRYGLSCRLIAANGSYLTWNGGALTSTATIGIDAVLDLGVIAAVDVFNPSGAGFAGDVVVCLRGTGTMIYLDASESPRVPREWSSWTTDAFPGYTCTTLYAPGTVILVATAP